MLPSTWFCEYLRTFSPAVGEIVQGVSLTLSAGVEALSSNGSCPQLSKVLTEQVLLESAGSKWAICVQLWLCHCETVEGRSVSLLHLLFRFLGDLTLKTYIRETALPWEVCRAVHLMEVKCESFFFFNVRWCIMLLIAVINLDLTEWTSQPSPIYAMTYKDEWFWFAQQSSLKTPDDK